jgi:DTW domain-containing protein YfiP
VPAAEDETPAERHLALEAILAFLELAEDDADQDAVPEFFQQMAPEHPQQREHHGGLAGAVGADEDG